MALFNQYQFFLCIEPFLFIQSKKEHYLWSKYPFKLSPPNENGAELFPMIVHHSMCIKLYSSVLIVCPNCYLINGPLILTIALNLLCSEIKLILSLSFVLVRGYLFTLLLVLRSIPKPLLYHLRMWCANYNYLPIKILIKFNLNYLPGWISLHLLPISGLLVSTLDWLLWVGKCAVCDQWGCSGLDNGGIIGRRESSHLLGPGKFVYTLMGNLLATVNLASPSSNDR